MLARWPVARWPEKILIWIGGTLAGGSLATKFLSQIGGTLAVGTLAVSFYVGTLATKILIKWFVISKICCTSRDSISTISLVARGGELRKVDIILLHSSESDTLAFGLLVGGTLATQVLSAVSKSHHSVFIPTALLLLAWSHSAQLHSA